MIQICNTGAEKRVASTLEPTTFEELPIASIPSMVLHVLTDCDLTPRDLAKLEETRTFFRHPAGLAPNEGLSITEVAALDLCQKRSLFRSMTSGQREEMKRNCGGSWKLVLSYLQAGEFCQRSGKPQLIAGPGHSILVTSKGSVYTFGSNKFGQLGLGNTEDSAQEIIAQPRLIRSLQGIRIVQAAVWSAKTMLVSEAGTVYAFGRESFGHLENVDEASLAHHPKLVESLKDIFVVQVTIGNYFTAVLSREGRVYTFSWGNEERLGHNSQPSDVQPSPLLGELENRVVVQIAAGNCYLLALAWEPSGMSVYSLGWGLGGKLGHGSTSNEKCPRLIEELQNLKLQPMMVSASSWHAAVVGKDGRVCTWGWGIGGCLGHGDVEDVYVPKVVEELRDVKAVNVATGTYITYVISEDGSVYLFGYYMSTPVGLDDAAAEHQGPLIMKPKKMKSVGKVVKRVVHINTTATEMEQTRLRQHAFALMESGELYAFGDGGKGQLGVKLEGDETWNPKLVHIDLDH